MSEFASLTFEQARDELTVVVSRLQAGTDSLQEALDLWERGERLAQRCDEFLTQARARVTEVLAETRPATDSPTRDG